MKKILLCLTVLFTFAGAVSGQTCTPDLTLPDTVIVFPLPYQDTVPGSGIMDTACVGLPFETVIQFKIPPQVVTQFGTFPINSVDLPTEGAVLNIPASMDYVCNPPNCVFKKDSTGCIVLFGTPQAGEENVYDLKVNVTIRSVLDLPFTLPDGLIAVGNYYLHIKPEGFPNCSTTGTSEPESSGLTAYNRPNPLNDFTEIVVNARDGGPFNFVVTDLLGRPLHREAVQIFPGENIISYDATDLPAGFYLYTLENGKAYTSGKMLVNRK